MKWLITLGDRAILFKMQLEIHYFRESLWGGDQFMKNLAFRGPSSAELVNVTSARLTGFPAF